MVSLYLTCSAEQPLCFEKLTLPMGKNKKSFFHGVHKKRGTRWVPLFFHGVHIVNIWLTRFSCKPFYT